MMTDGEESGSGSGGPPLVIANGSILDGTGSPSRPGEVLVERGVVVDRFSGSGTPVRVDASGCVVAPGFIDAHANLTWGPLADASCSIVTFQGVSTCVTGNCGGSLFPATGGAAGWVDRICQDHRLRRGWTDLLGYRDAVGPVGVDLAPMAGHATLRAATAGFVDRALTDSERLALESLTRDTLEQGAWGVSFGLTYPPGAFADDSELLAVCHAAAAAGAVAAFHIRLESSSVVASVDEVCRLAEDTGVRTVVCHHKALGRSNWGKTIETLARIDEALGRGADIALDLYPFTTAVRNLAMLLPDSAHEGGREALVDRLGRPGERRQLAQAMEANAAAWDSDWHDTVIADAAATPELEGRRADQLIAAIGLEGLLQALYRNDGRILTLYEGASWEDLTSVAAHPRTMVGSDGDSQVAADRGHPRSFRSIPRFLHEFVVQRQVLSLEEAVRRMTSLPASVFGLADRGTLETGARADICIFDPSAITAAATGDGALAEPWVRHLLVGGELAIAAGRPTAVRAGTVMARPGP